MASAAHNLHGYGYRQPEIKAYLERNLAALLDNQNPDGGFADMRDGTRLFDGWFRCATVGMICHVLYPESHADWHFRNTLGIGYFAPQPPAVLTFVSQPEQALTPEIAPVTSSAPAAFGADAARALERLRAKLASLDASRLAASSAVYQFKISGQTGEI